MTSIYWIARSTYLELVRDRVLYGVLVFGFFLTGLSLALGQLSFTEEARISIDFGLAGVQLVAQGLAAFLGITALSRELEKRTLFLFLVRPLSRPQFLLGKYVGLAFFQITFLLGLGLVFLILFCGVGFSPDGRLFLVFWGIFLESAVLLAAGLACSLLVRPFVGGLLVATLFLAGHWLSNLDYFIQKSSSLVFILAARILQNVLPDLERWNWRSLPVYEGQVPALASAMVYAMVWVGLYLAIANALFRRKDLV